MPLTTASGGTADASIFTRLRTPGGGHDPKRASRREQTGTGAAIRAKIAHFARVRVVRQDRKGSNLMVLVPPCVAVSVVC
jgi:hypothetical protein